MKNRILLSLLVIIACTQALSVGARADDAPGLLVFPSFSVRQVSGGLGGDQTAVTSDLRLGYRIASGFFFGMIYSNTSAGGSTTMNETAVGNSVGYFKGVFSLVGSVFLLGQSSQNTSTDAVTRTEATGFQVDVTLAFPISATLSVGPVLTLKSLTFRKKEDGAGIISSDLHPQSVFSPFLGAIFVF